MNKNKKKGGLISNIIDLILFIPMMFIRKCIKISGTASFKVVKEISMMLGLLVSTVSFGNILGKILGGIGRK